MFFELGINNIGIGYNDENNYAKLSTKAISVSRKDMFFENVQTLASLNMNLNNPLFNNDIQAGVNILYEDISFGTSIWHSITESASPNYLGYAGISINANADFDRVLLGASLNARLMNIVKDQDGLNYYLQAFPEDIALLRGFSAYLGLVLLEDENFKTSFFVNFNGNYSVIPAGSVFFKFDQQYAFSLKIELN